MSAWHSAIVFLIIRRIAVATLEQIQAKLKKLQAQAEVILAKKAQVAVDQIRALMQEHGLTTADIEAAPKGKRGVKALKGRASRGKVKAARNVKTETAPKYQHPETGATWSGRGRAPGWIAGAKDRSRFLVGDSAEATASANVRSAGAKTAARKSAASAGASGRKGQRKGPQPALYRDPKSGATWSGRGRAPAWLGANRSRFLIDKE
ncbi:H-NS family nucleoid-associated regulatory protein [Paraburkholderia fungorum]|uniref:H-NS family nucleoid-associated regulatory protein n=1 Tax=Paraburkholderia fungorum TaxID=134537 RepID=UPI0038BB302D